MSGRGRTQTETSAFSTLQANFSSHIVEVGNRKQNIRFYATLYADAFNDIVSGSNPGCGTSGFAATPGWDPVTGLGTPNFGVLLEKFLALP